MRALIMMLIPKSRTRHSVFAVCLLGTLVSAPVRAQAPATEPRVRKTPMFELYASDDETLDRAQREVEFADAQFQKYFGVRPSPIAVVIVDDVANARLETTSFLQRGLLAMPFISDRALDRIRGADTTASTTAKRASPPSPHRILGHEVCHQLFVDYVTRAQQGAAQPLAAQGSYGHPGIPDWFDEAVATLCERADLTAQRASELRDTSVATIPLAELLTMQHPMTGNTVPQTTNMLPAGAMSSSTLPPGVMTTGPSTSTGTSTVFMSVRKASGTTAEALRMRAFYAEVEGFIAFLLERSGPSAVRAVLDGLLAGRSSTEVVTSLPNMPHDVAELERAWRESARTR